MSLKKQATISFAWTFAQQFGNQFVGFIVSVILARLLLPEEFGLIGMIAVFIAIGNTLLHSGLTKSLIRGEELDNEDYSTVFYFNLFASIIIYIILFFLSPFIAEFYDQPLLISILRVYCLTFIIQAFSAVQLARLTKTLNFKTQTLVALPSAIVGGIVGITLAFLHYGVWSLVWSSVLSSTVNSLQLWIYSGWKPDVCFNYNKFKSHFNYGYKLALSELLDRIFSNIFLIVIGKYFSPAQVGFYTRAETMKQLPVRNISNVLDRVTFPLFVSIQNDDIRLKRAYKKLMKMVVFIITPVLVLLVILAEPIFVFLFTAKWIPAVPYFQILCVTGILYPLHSYNLTVLNVKGRSDLFLKLEVLKKALVIITLIITIPLGIISMLIGQVILSFIAFFINSHYTGKIINYTAFQQLRDILPVFILSIFIGISVLALDVYILDMNSDLIRIIVGSFTGFSMYLFLAYQLKFESFFELSKLLFKK